MKNTSLSNMHKKQTVSHSVGPNLKNMKQKHAIPPDPTLNNKDKDKKKRKREENKDDEGSVGFDWGDTSNTTTLNNNNNDNKSNNNNQSKSIVGNVISFGSRKYKKAKEIDEKEELLVDKSQERPQSTTDYERFLVGSPHSSFIWIRYMAYMLSLSEVEKARTLAERALQRIGPTETSEKLRVWIGYLNLESNFGTKETAMGVFERSLAYFDPKKMHIQFCLILGKGGNFQLADELYSITIRKFKMSKKVIIQYLDYLLITKNDVTAFRSALLENVKLLPRHKHSDVIKHAGILEYKHGDTERARTIFEGLVANNLNKPDLWLIYIDMELKTRNEDQVSIRRLFERSITMPFSRRSMRTIFKKYMEFEQSNGDNKGMEHVRQMALQYINR